jgi:3-phosphoshikimate 1-carboxyvinyltransferase
VTTPLWDAPVARGPVLADVTVPGSKSMTNRAVILAALADGRSTIAKPLRSRDSQIMTAALRSLGTPIDDSSDNAWVIDGGQFADRDASIDVGNAGTVLRFVPAIAPLARGAIRFDGDPAVRRRPVGPLLAALRNLGATVDDGGRGTAPFVVHGAGGLAGGSVSFDASSSSQLVSALLLAGARYDAGVAVTHVGDRQVPNAPHLAMTVQMLRDRQVTVAAARDHWEVAAGPVAPRDEVIEPDLSSAAPFLAAAAVTAGQVTIKAWPHRSTQPGAMLPELLEAFGATSTLDDDGLTLRGGDTIAGADLDLRDAGELTPVLAAVAAVANSPSRLVGIDYLRGHETDRIAALATELARLGAVVRETDDGLEIDPKPLHGNVFSTYDDHRMAMAGAVIGLVVPGVQVENVETTGKTLPDFVAMWRTAIEGQGAAR